MIRIRPFLLLRLTGIPFFIREIIQRKKVTIVLFHDISLDRIDMHLRVLRSKYNIIPLQDYVRAKEAGTVDQLPPRSLIITLDDGHKSNYQLKPLLEKYHIHATIFLCSGIVDTNRHFWWLHKISNDHSREELKKIPNKDRLEILRGFGFEETKEFDERQALSKNEIADMKAMVDFQSHTVFHPILPNCTTEEAHREISQSKKDLEEKYGLKVYALSYPNGDYSDRDISIAKKEGYTCGITVDVGFNSQDTDIFKLKRFSIRDGADINELLVKASGLWWYLEKIFAR
ncbi:polysaccharide deacetylase family protein [Methanococcoides methylutens]|uniref:polysaccharide deacetylase family protein n=1 Tax=Methanococcoides methylutens TaxID=2226 RepID=UPI0040446904